MVLCVFLTQVAVRFKTMSMRDANRGVLNSSCWNTTTTPLAKNARVLAEIPEEFDVSRWHVYIDHIPDMIENGVDSLKIEGRMKSIHYVSIGN